jgi:hypothetical protein
LAEKTCPVDACPDRPPDAGTEARARVARRVGFAVAGWAGRIRKTKPLPATYRLVLPIHIDQAGQDAFFERYAKSCVDHVVPGRHVGEGGPVFEDRYNELSTDADVIVYNGHAGLGQNVRKLATMGRFKSGKYQIFYMNGCDTFAYVDGSLAEAQARRTIRLLRDGARPRRPTPGKAKGDQAARGLGSRKRSRRQGWPTFLPVRPSTFEFDARARGPRYRATRWPTRESSTGLARRRQPLL